MITFITVGNYRVIKNIPTIVEAFYMFHNEFPDSRLIVIGINQLINDRYKEQKDGFNHNCRLEMYKGLMGESLIFTGGLPAIKVREYLWESDVFINNSDVESFCLSVAEAMAAGVGGFILSDIPSFRSLYGERAMYVKPKDYNGLYEKMKIIYEENF